MAPSPTGVARAARGAPHSTWKPLAAVAAVTLVAGIVAQAMMPGARTLAEILTLSH